MPFPEPPTHLDHRVLIAALPQMAPRPLPIPIRSRRKTSQPLRAFLTAKMRAVASLNQWSRNHQPWIQLQPSPLVILITWISWMAPEILMKCKQPTQQQLQPRQDTHEGPQDCPWGLTHIPKWERPQLDHFLQAWQEENREFVEKLDLG